jgi:lipopolysaccharide export system permease protein
MIPQFLIYLIPIAAVISVFLLFFRMDENSEAIVIKSAGKGPSFFLRPITAAALIMMSCGYFLTLYLNPQSFKMFRLMQDDIRQSFASAFLEEGSFVHPSSGLTLYIHKHLGPQHYSGIMIHDERNYKETWTLFSEEGHLILKENQAYISLNKGHRIQIDQKGGANMVSFDHYNTNIDFAGKGPKIIKDVADEKKLIELLRPSLSIKDKPNLARKYYVNAHERLSVPLSVFALMVFVAVYMSTLSFNRTKRWPRYIYLFLTVGLIEVSFFMFKHLTLKNHIFVVGMYFNTIFPLILSAYLVWRYRSLSSKIFGRL